MSDDKWHVVIDKKTNRRHNSGGVSAPKQEETIKSNVVHQDWNVRILNNNNTQKPIKQQSLDTPSLRRHEAPSTHLKKLESYTGEEDVDLSRVSFSLRQQIQSARQAKNMTQKQLANLCNLPESVIKNYENGTAVPDPQILNKLSRQLDVILKK